MYFIILINKDFNSPEINIYFDLKVSNIFVNKFFV